MQKNADDIVIFLIVVSALIMSMVAFIIFIILTYRKRQYDFLRRIDQIKLDHDKTLLSSKLEIQEQTFQHISREIHDNITLSLTLAKLNLHTLDWQTKKISGEKLEQSIQLLSKSIAELSDISKGLNSDVIIQQGLLEALENEMRRIRQTGLFGIDFSLTGNPVYMDAQKELIIFRVIQEAFNNIIKHSGAKKATLRLDYNAGKLHIKITDDGKGFDTESAGSDHRIAGLKNMKTRTKMLEGDITIHSQPGTGTSLSITIPFE